MTSTIPMAERLRLLASGHLRTPAGPILTEAAALIVTLVEAGDALIADVRRRYPGEELRCEHMRRLDAALTAAKGE